MKLRILNKLFWRYFKECPRKACFLYQKHQTFGMSVKRFKKKTSKEYMYYILEKMFLKIISNKDFDEKELKKYYLGLLNYDKFSIKNSDKYTLEEKEELIETINLMKDLQELELLLKIINKEDFKEFDTLKIKIKLKKYTKLKLNQDFEYELEIPIIQYLENKEVKIILFNHNGYPNFLYEYDSDINIMKKFIKEETNNKIREIIIYDFNSMCRYSIDIDIIHLKEIKSILSIIDKDMLFFNSNESNCYSCSNFNNCLNIMKKGAEWTL